MANWWSYLCLKGKKHVNNKTMILCGNSLTIAGDRERHVEKPLLQETSFTLKMVEISI